MGSPLSPWPERRPGRTASERRALVKRLSAHLPGPATIIRVSDRDLEAMKAAFIARFDEALPRTETLMAVAHIGYRMALRDVRDTQSPQNETPQSPAKPPQEPSP